MDQNKTVDKKIDHMNKLGERYGYEHDFPRQDMKMNHGVVIPYLMMCH
ncbi:MAG: hypothetical protein HQK67_11685, partial [Desulfamplus sp.]|nr:hypothetical protein [Desulfamplus sp.]